MAQHIINYGAHPNDGNGDPLRTAFIKTDENFDQLWAAGPVGSNITITNNSVQVTNTNGNLTLRPNGIGVVQTTNHVVPTINNLYNLGSAVAAYRALYAGTGGVNAVGNVVTQNSFVAPLRTVASNESGQAGQIAWDSDYIYVCVADNLWKRAALQSY